VFHLACHGSAPAVKLAKYYIAPSPLLNYPVHRNGVFSDNQIFCVPPKDINKVMYWHFKGMWCAVGWGPVLQARSWIQFLMVSLEFFLDIILPATLWRWGWLSLYKKWVPGIFPGV